MLPKKVLDLRGGAMGVTKDTFVKTVGASWSFFGAMFLLVPKVFWEMNFNSPAFTEATEFLARLLGVSISFISYMLWTGDADKLFVPTLVTLTAIAYFGPYTAEKKFDTTVMHKLPVVLMPALLLLGAAAYF